MQKATKRFEENILAVSYLSISFEHLASNTEQTPVPSKNYSVRYTYTHTQTNKCIINEANYAKDYKNYIHMI